MVCTVPHCCKSLFKGLWDISEPTYYLQRISCILILIKPSIEIEGFILQAVLPKTGKQNIRLEQVSKILIYLNEGNTDPSAP